MMLFKLTLTVLQVRVKLLTMKVKILEMSISRTEHSRLTLLPMVGKESRLLVT